MLHVPKSRHPAAKAGRFVRAFGQTLQSELEKKAAATAAAQPAKVAPPPPPKPVPTADIRGKTVFGIFAAALIGFGLVVLHFETLLPGKSGMVFRLFAAGVMYLEGYLLVSNWQKANQRLVQRVLNRVWGPRGAVTRREKTFARILREGLTLLGIAFLAAATFELVTAFVGD